MESNNSSSADIGKVCRYIMQDLSISADSVVNTVVLLEDQATVPFIARYRKERTGGLDEIKIRQISEKLKYYDDLEQRKTFIKKTIQEQKKLTDLLNRKIEICRDKQELEDLYLPFKKKKRSKAQTAVEKGLEPLAKIIFEQSSVSISREDILEKFINPEKGVNTQDEALAGAIDIIVENISVDPEIRKGLRNIFMAEGQIRSGVKKEWKEKKSKFEMYYEFSEPLKDSPSHRMLAIRRGANEGVITWKVLVDESKSLSFIEGRVILSRSFVFYRDMKKAVINAFKRISLSLEVEVFSAKIKQAEEEAINVFSRNLRNLLMEAPAGNKVIMGVDPGYRSGCKVVVIDKYGEFKEFHTIYPHPPVSDERKSISTVRALVEKYSVELVAIGDGTASRETLSFIKGIVPSESDVKVVVVSEAGASVYSASEAAIREFSELDVTVRGAISIARRLQDPLSELVKIDPKSIGVGQYQHDVNPQKLKESLGSVVESCVNFVGVEINTASKELLSYVSGLGSVLSRNIIDFRQKNGPFMKREDLLKVPGLGDKAFQQCAGFLRIRNSTNCLDNSSIHPESYHIVEKMAKDLSFDTKDLIGNTGFVKKIQLKNYVTDDIGMLTLKDIEKELGKPGHDPRDEFILPEYSDDIKGIENLTTGMELSGKITNVTNFGAFVDIGVHQDGLVHISKLSEKFVKDPGDIVSVGDRIKVRVLDVDIDLNRISLERLKKY